MSNMVGIAMASEFSTADFVLQMRGFQASDDARQKLFAHMLERYTTLLEEHSNLKNDYTSERDIRRNYQKAVDQMQRQVAETHRELENNSFVLALIDGDGVIFHDALLQAAGSDGGSEAASRLQHAIRAHLASLYSNSGNWPIMVHIYVSLDKLAQKLASVGMISHPQHLRTFAQGFSINQPLFSIVDVGHGKERADHKIKEMLRTFSNNPTCKHIIFGGCHDAGYLLNLDQYKHHANKAARITLLESTPAYKGFTDLPNFQRARFDHVFKNTPLPDFYPQFSQAPVQPSIQPPPVQAVVSPVYQPPKRAATNGSPAPAPVQPFAQTPPVQAIVSPVYQPPKRAATNGSPAPAPAPAPVQPTVNATPAASSPSTTVSSLVYPPTDSSESSWATVGKTGVPPNENISIAPKQNLKKKWAYYNKQGQRLDEPLPTRDPQAAASLDQRMRKSGRNLCNHWHLNKGKCHNKDNCKFQHEPKLTPAETVALRYKTRSLACKDRYCENIDCYLGHQCTFERDQGSCPYPDTCNLAHTHGMDRRKYCRWDEQGNEEIIGGAH